MTHDTAMEKCGVFRSCDHKEIKCVEDESRGGLRCVWSRVLFLCLLRLYGEQQREPSSHGVFFKCINYQLLCQVPRKRSPRVFEEQSDSPSHIILFSLFSLPQGDQIRCSPRKYTYKLNQKPPPHRADPAHGAAGPRHARRVLPVACLA